MCGSSLLKDMCDKLAASDAFECIAIESEEYCPIESHDEYNAMKTTVLCCIVTHGNNVGNLNFVRKVNSIHEAPFFDCQVVIEHVKEFYRTRAMRDNDIQP